jgi:hypothetical protein
MILLLGDAERPGRFGEPGRQGVAERYTQPGVADSIATQIPETVATR